MFDIDTHKVIDMIFSREVTKVTEYLKTYANIQIVSMDGSVTCSNAIYFAHPKVIQVTYRFHLLKNLTAYCNDYLTKFLKAQVVIDKDIYTSNNIDVCINENKSVKT